MEVLILGVILSTWFLLLFKQFPIGCIGLTCMHCVIAFLQVKGVLFGGITSYQSAGQPVQSAARINLVRRTQCR